MINKNYKKDKKERLEIRIDKEIKDYLLKQDNITQYVLKLITNDKTKKERDKNAK